MDVRMYTYTLYMEVLMHSENSFIQWSFILRTDSFWELIHSMTIRSKNSFTHSFNEIYIEVVIHSVVSLHGTPKRNLYVCIDK